MARKLPWAVNDDQVAKRRRTSPPAAGSLLGKESSSPALDEDANQTLPSNRGRASETNARTSSHFRTPSTSPVRAPPSIALMRGGYDKDDIYIMVEDEFETVAQSYTAHLHHAEYKRLMREARTAPPKELPEPTSPMSNEAKRRLQSAALQKRQGDALHHVVGKTSSEQDEDDKMSNLWSGTSLAPLMTQGSQQKTSLVGLERISSSTRAGSGFSRPKSDPKSSSAHLRDEEISDSDEPTPFRPGSRSRLDGQAQPPQRAPHHTDQPLLPRGTPLPIHKQGERAHRPASSILDIHEQTVDRHDSRNKWTDHSTRPKAQAIGSSFMKRKSDKEKERQARLDDVPLFII